MTETAESFENDIELYLQQFCEEQQIDNLRSVSQTVWNACLIYIYNHAFKDTNRLKLQGKYANYNNNNSNLAMSNCGAYNIEYVNYICDYYIYICGLYDKGCTISGFCKLTGIKHDTIWDWGRGARVLDPSAREIYEKLITEYEDSGESKLWSNKNPVAMAMIMNRRFSWNLPGVSRESVEKPALSAADVRQMLELNCAKLPDNSAQAETIEVDCAMSNCVNNSNNLGQAENVGNKPLFDGNNTE